MEPASQAKVLPSVFTKGSRSSVPLPVSQTHDLQSATEAELTKSGKKTLKHIEKVKQDSVGVLFLQVLKLKGPPAPCNNFTAKVVYDTGRTTTKWKSDGTKYGKWNDQLWASFIPKLPVSFTVQLFDSKEELLGAVTIIEYGKEQVLKEGAWYELEARKRKVTNTLPSSLASNPLKIKLSYQIHLGLQSFQLMDQWVQAKTLIEKPPPFNSLIRTPSKHLLPGVTIFDLIELNAVDDLEILVMTGDPDEFNRMVCKGKSGNSPLHVACLGCNIRDRRILEILLDIPGIDVNAKNVSNNSPLHYFCSKWADPDVSILDVFLKKNADVNVLNDSKETPLLKAITNTRIRKVLMQKLLEHGADPDILNSHNEGVLHYAARLARVDLIQLLLKYCTNLRVKGAEGMVPHEIAYEYAQKGDPMLKASYLSIAVVLEKAHALHVWLSNNQLKDHAPYLIENKLWLHKLGRMTPEEYASLDLADDVKVKMQQSLSIVKVAQSKRSLELAKLKKTRNNSQIMKQVLHQIQEDIISELFVISPEKIEFTDELGKGAAGVVWKGVYRPDIKTEPLSVAIKVLFGSNTAELKEFKKELRVLCSVTHVNVVKLIGISLQPSLSMIMEYCAYGSLFHVMKNTDITYAWKLFFMHCSQAVAGLNALHQNNPQILHRDMKSLNLLVAEDWSVRVADFGTAGLGVQIKSDDLRAKGTAAYLAPEIIEGGEYTIASDVYALGIVFWEMLYRTIKGNYQRPYAEFEDIKGPAQRMILMYQASKKGLRPTIPESTPPVIRDLISSMMSADPDERPDLVMVRSMLDAANIAYRQNPSEWREFRQVSHWNVEGLKKQRSLKSKFTRKQLSTLPSDSNASLMSMKSRTDTSRATPEVKAEAKTEVSYAASHVQESSRKEKEKEKEKETRGLRGRREEDRMRSLSTDRDTDRRTKPRAQKQATTHSLTCAQSSLFSTEQPIAETAESIDSEEALGPLHTRVEAIYSSPQRRSGESSPVPSRLIKKEETSSRALSAESSPIPIRSTSKKLEENSSRVRASESLPTRTKKMEEVSQHGELLMRPSKRATLKSSAGQASSSIPISDKNLCKSEPHMKKRTQSVPSKKPRKTPPETK
eukprot:TRINITY_DN1350_c0_g1_i1.p1 TRINITY_DN1350_c0_g1~~TRINITY_DN1350_c0_g1_i1.p1  ORF type:complete len:1118 (-),score=211.74 TRINITY_DN1350_c0_g1_i1:40-3369(-)